MSGFSQDRNVRFQLPHQRNHDVRKILTHAAARPQRIVNRRINFRNVRRVVHSASEWARIEKGLTQRLTARADYPPAAQTNRLAIAPDRCRKC
jgi:uncharacterized circularly permuted ATP-grasp superfamily protein